MEFLKITREAGFFPNWMVLKGYEKHQAKFGLETRVQEIADARDGLADLYFPISVVDGLREELRANPGKVKRVVDVAEVFADALWSRARELEQGKCSLEDLLDAYEELAPTLGFTTLLGDALTSELEKTVPSEEFPLLVFGRATPLEEEKTALFKLALQKARGADVEASFRQHVERFSCLPVGWVGEPYSEDYFRSRLEELASKGEAHIAQEAARLAGESEEKTAARSRLLGKYPASIRQAADALALAGYLNELRKYAFSRANIALRKFFAERGLKWKDLIWLTRGEMEELARTQKLDEKLVSERRKRFCIACAGSVMRVRFASPEEFGIKREAAVSASELKGTPASPGTVKGIVRVIRAVSELAQFKEGEVLVSPATSVEFTPFMKRAKAIVTDEGGMACHAAVISREFGIPCVVGTKTATAAFKSGDFVEVDAAKGIVRRLEVSE
jgi:phosphohistidine swiveling domain-containing protein